MTSIKDLKPDSHNANRGSARGQKQIVGSIQRNGFGRSGLLDKDGRVIAGNKTLEASTEVFGVEADVIIVESDGTKPVYVKRVDLDLDDPDPNNPARRLAYEDNVSSWLSFDLDPAVVMADMESGFDFEAIGVNLEELGEMLEGSVAELLKGGRDADEPPPVNQTEAEKYQAIWQVNPGDVWQLGRHKIACLDSLDEENVRQSVGDSKVEGVWADPPYGIAIVATNGYVGGGEAYDIPFGGVNHRQRILGGGSRHHDKTGRYYIQEGNRTKGLGSIGGAKPFGTDKPVRGSDGASNVVPVGKYAPVIGDETTETAERAAALYLSLFPDACHIWWGANYYTHVLNPSPGWIVWDKDNTGNFADCELAWTNQEKAARIFEHRWNGMLKASEQGQRRVHPTQKPVALFQECFREYGKGGLILDPFLGSGISVLGAENLGEAWSVIGFELAPEYIATTLQRWTDLTSRDPIRVSG